ncbi:MAG: BACON domain-containing protein [Bacteroidales bacterium]|nr:BACON domain-containing protein [Bacteroidales bacterium]
MCPIRTLCVLTLAVTSLMFSACKQELDFDEASLRPGQAEASFSSGYLNLNFPYTGGTASVDLDAPGDWKASFVNDRTKDWCSLSTENGKRGKATITVSVRENGELEQRSANIKFSCGDDTRTIVVTQKQKDAVLVSSNRVDVKEKGGVITINVRANLPYEYIISEESKSWIQPMETKAVTSASISFRVSRNEEFSKREGSILFRSETNSEMVKVYQDGASPSIVVSGSEISISHVGGSFNVEVQHNVSVSVHISPDCKWIQESRTKSMSTSTFRFNVDKNTYFKERQGWIAFKNDESNAVDTLLVTQDPYSILITKDTLYFSGYGSSTFFDVEGSDPKNYKVVPEDDWLTLTGNEVISGNSRFHLAAQPLEVRGEPRVSHILVYPKGSSEPDIVNARQLGRLPAFSYSFTGKETTLPKIEGTNLWGYVFWGDGFVESYRPDSRHIYNDSGTHTVLVELNDPRKVSMTELKSGMRISFKDINK